MSGEGRTPSPGIERGMTAVPQHSVVSHLTIGMRWEDAEALFITLDSGISSGALTVAPSHVDAVHALRDLLAERIYVVREVVTKSSRLPTTPARGQS